MILNIINWPLASLEAFFRFYYRCGWLRGPLRKSEKSAFLKLFFSKEPLFRVFFWLTLKNKQNKFSGLENVNWTLKHIFKLRNRIFGLQNLYFTARRQMGVNFQRILTRFEVICSQDQTMDEHRRRFLDFYLFFCWNCKMLDIWCQIFFYFKMYAIPNKFLEKREKNIRKADGVHP